MTTQRPASAHSKHANHHEENAPMNSEILSQLETQRREADVRHHLDERSLERAANRRRHRTAAPDTHGRGMLNRFIGWLAPNRVATASGTLTEIARQEQPAASRTGNACPSGMDCAASTANRAA